MTSAGLSPRGSPAGRSAVTSPAPARNAPRAARNGAPVKPDDPPITRIPPAQPFVGVARPARQRGGHVTRFGEEPRRARQRFRGRQGDRDDHQFPASTGARVEQAAQLRQGERNRDRGADRLTRHGAGIRVHARKGCPPPPPAVPLHSRPEGSERLPGAGRRETPCRKERRPRPHPAGGTR